MGRGLWALLGKEAIAGAQAGWCQWVILSVACGRAQSSRQLSRQRGTDGPGGRLAMVGGSGGSCWGSASVRNAS